MTKTTDEQLAELTTALAALRQDYAAITAKLNTAPDAASVQAKDAKITALETQVTALMDAGKVQAKASAAALVRKAISEGKIPGQDVKVIESWTNLIVIDAKNADLLDSLPVNAALKTIVQAGAGGSGAGGAAAKTDAEQFVEVVKAKHVELKDKSKALDAAMVEKPDLYKAWRAADGKPGL